LQNIEWLIRIGYYGNADLGAAAASDEHLSSWGSSAVELLDPLDTCDGAGVTYANAGNCYNCPLHQKVCAS